MARRVFWWRPKTPRPSRQRWLASSQRPMRPARWPREAATTSHAASIARARCAPWRRSLSGQPPAESQTLTRAGLRVAAIEGVRWMALARVAAELLTVGSSIVLAHLVSPRQFGMLAVAVIVRELALMTANEGVGTPLVQ